MRFSRCVKLLKNLVLISRSIAELFFFLQFSAETTSGNETEGPFIKLPAGLLYRKNGGQILR